MATAGYQQGAANQPAAAIDVSGPLPALFFVAGNVLVAFYPISREKHARILRALEKKRALRHRLRAGQARAESESQAVGVGDGEIA